MKQANHPGGSRLIQAAGIDRLGIVSHVTSLVTEAGGNMGESEAGRLGPSYFFTLHVGRRCSAEYPRVI